MNQALLMSYTIGSLLGPTLTAMLMQNFSDNLLFIMIASVSFIYLLTLLRKSRTSPDAGGTRLIPSGHRWEDPIDACNREYNNMATALGVT